MHRDLNFQMEFISRWTSTLILTVTMRYDNKISSHTEERKLTSVQISRIKVKQTWLDEHDQRRMAPPLLLVSSVRKAVRRSYPFCSVQCSAVTGLKSFLSLVWEWFCG